MLDPLAGRCAERTGFLFPHDCGNEAVSRCDSCQKAICVDHRHGVTEQDYCSTCAKRLPDARQRFHETPFFYGPTWYPSSGVFSTGNDPDDFTDADGVSTLQEGSEAFERDLGAS